MRDCILVFDFGGQYAHLIARRFRELGVHSEIVEPHLSNDQLNQLNSQYYLKGFILSGGPSSVYDSGAPPCNQRIFGFGVPLLGICYGHQLLAKHFGGIVERGTKSEYGLAALNVRQSKGVLNGMKPNETVWISHADL